MIIKGTKGGRKYWGGMAHETRMVAGSINVCKQDMLCFSGMLGFSEFEHIHGV